MSRYISAQRAARLAQASTIVDGLLRADAGRFVALLAQFLGGRLVEDVQEVVVAHLEHLGRDAHAQRVALALVEVDDNAESHHDLQGSDQARRHRSADAGSRAGAALQPVGERGEPAVPGRTDVAHPLGDVGERRRREPVDHPPAVALALDETRVLEHAEVLDDGLARHRHVGGEVGGRRGLRAQRLDDGAPGRVGERGEDEVAVRHGRAGRW